MLAPNIDGEISFLIVLLRFFCDDLTLFWDCWSSATLLKPTRCVDGEISLVVGPAAPG